jgi:6-phosphogluconolactonase (cycloisomerase 2 family)
VVKNSEGINYFLKGVPNKKTLYGYNETYNKLIELDVSNYTINPNTGTLSLKADTQVQSESTVITIETLADWH